MVDESNTQNTSNEPKKTANNKYETNAVISIPFRFNSNQKGYEFQSSMWKDVALNAKEINSLGLLPHVKELFDIHDDLFRISNTGTKHQNFDGNDIRIYELKTDRILNNILSGDDCKYAKTTQTDNKKSYVFRFSHCEKGNKQDKLFWSTPKLVMYPLTHIGMLTLPVYHYENSQDEVYKFYDEINASLLSDNWHIRLNVKGNRSISDSIGFTMKEIFHELTRELDSVSLLITKSIITFIYAYNPDLVNKGKDEIKKCAGKLAYANSLQGFVTDEKETSFLQILDSQKLYSSSGPFGASFVTDTPDALRVDNLNKYFWIYMILIVQRYSLLNMLFELNATFSNIDSKKLRKHKNLRDLQMKYQDMCKIKAGLYFTEISDQYHNMRLYHNFFDALNIKTLYNEVEEKLEALDKYLSIEKDKQSWLSQKIIAALVLLLTATSGVDDFLDILEDPTKIHPGIISLLVAIAIIVTLWHKEES